MRVKTGAILLIAGTSIGSGMIALPMTLSKLGILPSIFLMLMIWGLAYYTSLINLELNLQAGKGMSLGELGKHFSGKSAQIFGEFSLKILSYALLSVYIYAGSSVVQKLIGPHINLNYICTCYTLGIMLLLILPFKGIDYINRVLFMGLLIVSGVLITGLTTMINWDNLPLFSNNYTHIETWSSLIPVVFTSFGFQVIFHTLTNYCNQNVKLLKSAFFWGSLIPAIIYIVWTCSVISVIFHENPDFYAQMINGKIEIGDLVIELTRIAKWPAIQVLVWWISLLAIITSLLGVGIGLFQSINTTFKNKMLSALITIIPPYITAIIIPNAFITVLGFAGLILSIIAIAIPVFLLEKIKNEKSYYPQTRNKFLIFITVVGGIIIIASELFNMFFSA